MPRQTCILPLAAVGLVLAELAGPALSDECAVAGSQSALARCAEQSFKAADAGLNAAYKEIRSRLRDNPSADKLLQTAQRAWLGFRDAECAFATAKSSEGSAHPMLFAICQTELTNARVRQLDTYLDCQEGDLSCPLPAN